MIAHVAEASEQSGRVVLWLDPELPSPPALLEAPVRLAAAFGAEIETVIISHADEDSDDELPVRHIRRTAAAHALSVPDNGLRFEFLVRRSRRAAEEAAAVRGVKVGHALAHGDPIDRISEMCLDRGPWNIVTLPRVPVLGAQTLIGTLLANVGGATGFLLCADGHPPEHGPVLIITEDVDHLPGMMRAAERLADPGDAIHVLIAADTAIEHADLDAQARLVLADQKGIRFEASTPTFGVPGALIGTIAKLRPGLIIARFGGAALADGRELARTSAAARAPILLVR